jgi:RNA polymerase-binding protein DksA
MIYVAKKPSIRKSVGQAKVVKGAAAKSYKKVLTKAIKSAAQVRLKKSPLSKSELEEFRQMLIAKRRDLIGDMSGMESGALRTNRQEGSGDLSNMPTHPADIGSDNFEHEFTLGLLESERALLAEIDEALERVDQGTLGICLGTGKPIGVARLRARPWAKYCIEYARMVEKGLVRPGQKQEPPPKEGGEELEEDLEEPEEHEEAPTAVEEPESPVDREVEEDLEE